MCLSACLKKLSFRRNERMQNEQTKTPPKITEPKQTQRHNQDKKKKRL